MKSAYRVGEKILGFSYDYESSEYVVVVAGSVHEEVDGNRFIVETQDGTTLKFLFDAKVYLKDVKRGIGYSQYQIYYGSEYTSDEHIQDDRRGFEEDMGSEDLSWEDERSGDNSEEEPDDFERRRWMHEDYYS